MAVDHAVVLSNDAILLREFRADDAEAIYQAVRESIDQLGGWLSWCRPDYCLKDTTAFLAARADAFQADGEYAFAITQRVDRRFLGACSVNQFERAALRANLGYWLRTSATGSGYATQAVQLLAGWAFETLGLERIEIVAAAGNSASQRVAERAGAVREGVARRRLRVHDVQHDAIVFSLIAADFHKEIA